MSADPMQDTQTLAEYTKAVQAETIQKFLQDQTDGTAVALPDSVHVWDLENYLELRRRFRGTMNTTVLDEFVEYVSKTSDSYNINVESYPCFVNPDSMTACAFFNLGDVDMPGHGDHSALLSLRKTQAYKELLDANGGKFGQREFAEWMEDWADMLSARTQGGQDLPLHTAVAAIRRITLGGKNESTSEEQSFSSRRSAMAEVEAQNKDQLPAFLTFTCEPYQGLQQRPFTLRLNIINGDTPRIGARIVRLESAEEDMAKEFEQKLRTGFEDTAVDTFVGVFHTLK
ncbi:MAG: DUF2303 family protein [Marinobacter sp.]|nr:DUF2303 family protein [Marinobacter sp.]